MSRRGRADAREHPPVTLNDVLRFALELWGWGALAWFGFTYFDAWPAQVAVGVGAPVLAAAAWATFRVPNDPKPRPPVEVPGQVRLMIEFDFFALATAALIVGGARTVAVLFVLALVAHYAIAWPRLVRLAKNEPLPAPGHPGGVTG